MIAAAQKPRFQHFGDWCIQPGGSDETDTESGWFGSESEEEEVPEPDDLWR